MSNRKGQYNAVADLESTNHSTMLERLSQSYRSNAAIRALVGLLALPVPIVSGLDAALVSRLDQISEARARTFFDELSTGCTELTPELIQTEDFLHAYFATLHAALHTRRREKIRWFAHLLRGTLGSNPQIKLEDEYEDLLTILDELSYREMGLLTILAEFEDSYSEAPGNDLNHAMTFWNTFASEACKRLGLLPSEVGPLLTRLNRTGAYETFTETAYNYSGNMGKVTALYRRLARIIEVKGEQFASMGHPNRGDDLPSRK